MSDRTETATLREFNRTWTQRVGVLEESFLGTGRPLIRLPIRSIGDSSGNGSLPLISAYMQQPRL